MRKNWVKKTLKLLVVICNAYDLLLFTPIYWVINWQNIHHREIPSITLCPRKKFPKNLTKKFSKNNLSTNIKLVEAAYDLDSQCCRPFLFDKSNNRSYLYDILVRMFLQFLIDSNQNQNSNRLTHLRSMVQKLTHSARNL